MSDHPWGRIAEDGSVFVRLPDGGEHKVGQWSAGDPKAGLAYYQRRYLDLMVEADLMAARVAAGKAAPDDTSGVAARLRAAVQDPSCVGDLSLLASKADELDQAAAKRRANLAGQKAMAKTAAAKEREDLAKEAESLAESTQWKKTGDRFKELLERWQKIPRFNRAAEQAQWQRFSKARTQFDKTRKVHFAQLDGERAEAVKVKQDLIRRAEAMSASTEWGPTTRAYRELMDEWKLAPRAARNKDNELWSEFRAAQDVFFDARNEVNSERDSEEQSNLAKKEELVKKAESILPVRDLRVARSKFGAVLDQWEEIGHIPRSKQHGIDQRMRKVENAITAAEQDFWKRSDPAGKARAEATVESFTKAVSKLQKQLPVAEARGDEKRLAELDTSIAAKQALVDAAKKTLAEFV